MNKRYMVGIISALIIGLFFAASSVSADNPHGSYIVCGEISNGANDVTLTITNEDTDESLSRETYNGGEFQFNIGNLPSGWSRGANMTIEASDGYTGSTSFTVNAEGTIQQEDLTVTATGGGGGGGTERGIDPAPQGMILVYAIFIVLFIAIVGGALYMYTKDQT